MSEFKLPVELKETPEESSIESAVMVKPLYPNEADPEINIYGLDLVPKDIKDFKLLNDYVLIAILQEAPVLFLLTGKSRTDSKSMVYKGTMVVSVGSLVGNLTPGDVVHLRRNMDGTLTFGGEAYMPFKENMYSIERINNFYGKKAYDYNGGREYTEKQIFANDVPFDVNATKRLLSYYIISSREIIGVYPESYKDLFFIQKEADAQDV